MIYVKMTDVYMWITLWILWISWRKRFQKLTLESSYPQKALQNLQNGTELVNR